MKAKRYENDPQVSITPTKLNARPIHSSPKPNGILHTGPRPTRHTWHAHPAVTEAWMHTVPRVRLKINRGVTQVASSLTYLEQTSTNGVNFRNGEHKKKLCCVSSLTNKTVLNAKIQARTLRQDTEAFCILAESQINQAVHLPPSPSHTRPNYEQARTAASLLVTRRGTVFCGLA